MSQFTRRAFEDSTHGTHHSDQGEVSEASENDTVSRDETHDPEEADNVRRAFMNGTVSGYEAHHDGQGRHARDWLDCEPGS